MSYVFDALQQAQRHTGRTEQAPWEIHKKAVTVREPERDLAQSSDVDSISLHPAPKDRIVALGDPKAIGAEKFRVLASRVRQAQTHLHFRKLLVTSSTIGDGKSLLTANLGISMAKYAGYRVLLIDSDYRRAQLSALMNCQSSAGLTEWLSKGGAVGRYLRRCSETLWCMPAGEHHTDSQQQFDVDYVSKTLASIVDLFDLVLVDSPPVTMLAGATIWLGVADTCLLVVRRGQTPKRLLERALSAIAPSKMLGIILNDFNDSTHPYYSQYYSTTNTK